MQIGFLRHLDAKSVFTSNDFYSAVSLSIILSAILWEYPPPADKQSYLALLVGIYITIGAALFSMVSATYAIFTGLTEPKFLIFLTKVNALNAYISAFMVTALASMWAVMASLVSIILIMSPVSHQWPTAIKHIIHWFDLTLILYALTSALMIVRVISDYMRHRSNFYMEVFGMERDSQNRELICYKY
jgi:hypothetical protein